MKNMIYRYSYIGFLPALLSMFLLSACGGGSGVNDVQTLDLYPVKSGDKFQYINKDGKVVINPQFNDACVFRNGLALVLTSSQEPKYGFVDKDGKIIINPIYKDATVFSDDLAWVVQSKGAPVSINKKGEIISTQSNAYSVKIYSEGLAAFCVKEKDDYKWGFVDKTGKVVINPQFAMVNNFSGGRCAVQNADKKWGFIDKEGKILINYQFDNAFDYVNGKAVIRSAENYGVVDLNGKLTINPQFKSITPDGDKYLIQQDGKWGWCDNDGKIVINPQFDAAFAFGKGDLASVKSGSNYGFIDKAGKIIINPQFDEAYPFNGSLALIKSSGKYGFIDQKGKIVINPQFDAVSADFVSYITGNGTMKESVITDKDPNSSNENKSEENSDNDDSNNSDNKSNVSDLDKNLIGKYNGNFGDKYIIKINIKSIDGKVITGDNSVYNKASGALIASRPFKGSKIGKKYILNEPGDSQFDGFFEFVFEDNTIRGFWKHYSSNEQYKFDIEKS
jgi:hypothetical protein